MPLPPILAGRAGRRARVFDTGAATRRGTTRPYSVRTHRRFAALLALGLCAGASAEDYLAAPWLLYRDANPFVAAGGLPFAPPTIAAGDRWRVDAAIAASNTEIAFAGGGERLFYDMEIHEARIAVTRSFGEHWVARATLAGTRFGGGFLDSFIEDFHRAFGFTNGDRGRLGGNGHTIDYADSRGDTLALTRARSGVAPLLLDLAWRAPADGHEWLVGATLKLPTSHASPLLDDRAIDLSLWLAAQSTAATRLPWGLRAGLTRRGDTDLLPRRAEDLVAFVDATLGYSLTSQWSVAAQYQWHDAPYDSAIPMLRAAGNLSVSTAWRARAGWTLRAGLVEDLPARHAQDVTFFVGLSL
ncbi:DUF3187 family protein [Dokdonella sp.]|uniref:DUF3187 family protein n=1 Tax=Dokdonella sp. TaxID=2291710 RepID=UPI001B0DD6F6|nr:DUF3187 family protein [Dokdonella sp.]MBO9662546.1 DUF3187 family protein [Dokdonella sp.]